MAEPTPITATTCPGKELRLCPVDAVAEGEALRVDIDGRPPLAVYNVDGTFYVSDDTCSHGEASLSEGMVSDGRIECPWHTGSFCLKTGEALTSPADTPIRVYPVTLKDGAVFITPEDAA
jgi:nitrite reductase/ring-hydroxylating ferredoxin subunit